MSNHFVSLLKTFQYFSITLQVTFLINQTYKHPLSGLLFPDLIHCHCPFLCWLEPYQSPFFSSELVPSLPRTFALANSLAWSNTVPVFAGFMSCLFFRFLFSFQNEVFPGHPISNCCLVSYLINSLVLLMFHFTS